MHFAVYRSDVHDLQLSFKLQMHVLLERQEDVSFSGTLMHCYFQRCLGKSEDSHKCNIYMKAVKTAYLQITEM